MKEDLKSLNPKPKGCLYICATPIGNLADCSHRLISILKNVALVAAEDTRRTSVLLGYCKSQVKQVSLQKYNEASRVAYIRSYLDKGDDVALVSDAGTPGVCDPGSFLISQLSSYIITPIPGPSAVTALLSVAGISADHYVFSGFFPKKISEKEHVFQVYSSQVLFFFESPKRILKTCKWLEDNLQIESFVLGKELTKKFESIYRDIKSAILYLDSIEEVKGEWCMIVKAKLKQSDHDPSAIVKILKKEGLSLKQAVAIGGQYLGLSRNFIYEKYHA